MNFENLSIGSIFLTIANIIWTFTLLTWNQGRVKVTDCTNMRNECMGDRVLARTNDTETKVLSETLEFFSKELKQSKSDREKLFNEVRHTLSVLGDVAMAIQILSAKQLKDDPQTIDVVMRLLHKGKPEVS